MILRINNPASPELYVAHFHHENWSWDMLANWRTICTVHYGPCAAKTRPCNTPGQNTGQALCSVRDNFCKATGRKIAFGRAIATFPRPVRTLLWREYLRQSGITTN